MTDGRVASGDPASHRPAPTASWPHAIHLVRRFVQVARPEPLTPAEQRHVDRILRGAGADVLALFWAQSPADQRHAFATMRRSAVATTDAAVHAAALVHDVGKATHHTGAVVRSVATVLDLLHLPMSTKMRAYRKHGAIGAELLEAAGATPLAVEFARRHPDPDPGSMDAEHWRILLAADDV